MASFFSLPELRSELNSLGHDDVPDHVILSFLSQLQISMPNCFTGEDRSPSDPSRPASSYLEPDQGAENALKCQNPDKKGKLFSWENEAIGKRNVRFEEKARNQRLDLQEELFGIVPLGRPSTPPRCNNPVISYMSDSDSSKENRENSTKEYPHSHGSSLRQALQPCDNVVFESEINNRSNQERYMYPGDILAKLKARQRPISCPEQRETSEDSSLDGERIRSFSATGLRHNMACENLVTRRHRVLRGRYHVESTEYTGSCKDSGQFGNASEIHSVKSLEVEEAIDNVGCKLKPLNVGVVRHSVTHKVGKQSESESESECSARTTNDSPRARTTTESPRDERPSSRGSTRSNCAACQLLRESGTPKFRHFSMRKRDGEGEDSSNSSLAERDADDNRNRFSLDNGHTQSPSPGVQRRSMSELKTHSPSFSDGLLGGKKALVRRGKIDRVARFAEMQKVWNKDHFLKATNGKRKSQSFHRMFAEIHASNERQYAASRARSVMGVRDEPELPPFVLTT